MTDRDKIELPLLPRADFSYSTETMERYGRAAVLADRERRGEQAKSAKPKVHSKWIELFPHGDWKTSPGCASYRNTSTMLNICWTDDGHAWIANKRNWELAMQLRNWSIDDSFATLDKAADALDGGQR